MAPAPPVWQHALRVELGSRLPAYATCHVAGSTRDASQLDGWSDLDLHLDLGGGVEPLDLLAGLDVWASTEAVGGAEQVLRVVLTDGRRLDLVVTGGRVRVPRFTADNDIRFLAAQAAAKLGRGDQLIGLHLVLDLLRSCLVLAMQLRDRDLATTVHRHGSDRDALADDVTTLLGDPLTPDLVLGALDLYTTWRTELDPTYSPDWTPLAALIARGQGQEKVGPAEPGLGQRPPTGQ